jgi:hypothetical protein
MEIRRETKVVSAVDATFNGNVDGVKSRCAVVLDGNLITLDKLWR